MKVELVGKIFRADLPEGETFLQCKQLENEELFCERISKEIPGFKEMDGVPNISGAYAITIDCSECTLSDSEVANKISEIADEIGYK